MSSYMNQVANILLRRRRPISQEELADRTGASDKTVRNYLTEESRIENWLPEGKIVVVLRGNGGNQYCVRDADEISSEFSQGGSHWVLAEDTGTKALYSPV